MARDLSFDWNHTKLKKYLQLDNWDFIFASKLIAGFEPNFENSIFAKMDPSSLLPVDENGKTDGSEKCLIFPAVYKAEDGFILNDLQLLGSTLRKATDLLEDMKLIYRTSNYRLTGRYVGPDDNKEKPFFDNEFSPVELVRPPNWWVTFFYNNDINPDWYEWAEEEELIKLIHLDQESTVEYDEDRYPEELAIANIIYQALMKSNSKDRPTEQIKEYLEQYYPKIKKDGLKWKRLVTVINWKPGNKN